MCAYPRISLKLTVVQGLSKGGVPLFPSGMEISQNAISGHGARLKGSSLAIVELILDSLPKKGTPAQVLFAYLGACFTSNPQDLRHFRCTINVNAKTKDLQPHQRKLNDLHAKLKR